MDYEFLTDTENAPEIPEVISQISELETGVTLERTENLDFLEQTEAVDLVAGTPETDLENWHMQSEDNSCAICCQEFVAEQLLNQEFSEREMAELATENGWYDPETGTSIHDMGNVLEALGLEVTRETGLTLSDLFQELEEDHKVICGVNNIVLENADYSEIPGIQANHVVEVIGIDYSDPEQVQIVLNDSGVENGQGRTVSADTFLKAWETSGRYSVTAQKGAA